MRSRFGEPVIGNFPCKLDRYKKANYTYVPNNKLTPDFLISFSKEFFKDKPVKEGAILLIIDECQLMFNSRDWQRKGREEWLSFFSLHRHLGYDIVLIAQMDRMIDRQIRGLIEYEYVHRKLNNYGWRGLLLRCVTMGANFISVKVWYPMKEKVSQDIFRASKRYYSIYDTYVMFDGDGFENSGQPEEKEKKNLFIRVTSDFKSKYVILLRSFFITLLTKIFLYNLPPGFPFWLVTQIIFIHAHTSFAALDISGGYFMSFFQWIKLYSKCFRLQSFRGVRACFSFMTGSLKLDDSTLKS